MININDWRIIEVEAARIMRQTSTKECCVYVMFAKDDGGPMYIKVGISATPGQRALGVQTGCPIKIRRTVAFTCSSRETARAAELAFHAALEPHKSNGEWFKMEWSDEAKDVLFSLIEGVMDAIRGENLREITTVEAKKEKRVREERWEHAQRKAKTAAYNKYRLTVELRAPVAEA